MGTLFYLNNKKQGEYKYYWYNGQLCIHCFYLNGKVHGEYKGYNSNGQLSEHCFYLNGSLIKDCLQ